MKGSVLMGITLGIAVAAGVGLWYTTERAYYREITGVQEVFAYGDGFPVRNYQGIDADTSPLKMRACFDVDWDYWPDDTHKDTATPLNAPKWFECFDAKQIGEDLKAGKATAILADANNPYGFDRYIAQYEDGRAFMWRQINHCGEAHFSGDELPEGCSPPEGDGMEKTPETASGGIGPVDFTIRLVPAGGGAAEEIAITDPVATSDNARPESFWACFKVAMSVAMVTETYETIETVAPLAPVSQLGCFDAQQITDDVRSGAAIAVQAERFVTTERVVVLYDDGQAFAWDQGIE